MLRGCPGAPAGPGDPEAVVVPTRHPLMLLQLLRDHSYGQHQEQCLFWKLLLQEWDLYHGMEEEKVVSATWVHHPGTVLFSLPVLL